MPFLYAQFGIKNKLRASFDRIRRLFSARMRGVSSNIAETFISFLENLSAILCQATGTSGNPTGVDNLTL